MDTKSPFLQQLYRDWERWRGKRVFPTRAAIDPLALRYILGNLSLVDVFYDPLRFHFRIHATSSAERMGFDLTGKYLDELPDEHVRETVRKSLTAGLERRAPFLRFHEQTVATKVSGYLEVLILPFSSDGEVIDAIAFGTQFTVPRDYHLRTVSAGANPA